MKRSVRFLALFLMAFILAATIGRATTASAQAKTLYERLGGKDAITAVVNEFLANVAADSRINSFFANTDIPRLAGLLVDQICEATGGPCQYTGRDMKTTHMGMGITDAQFNALVEDLVKALDTFNVPEQEKGELLGALGMMRGDIVEQPAGMPTTGVGDNDLTVWLLAIATSLLGTGMLMRRRFAQTER